MYQREEERRAGRDCCRCAFHAERYYPSDGAGLAQPAAARGYTVAAAAAGGFIEVVIGIEINAGFTRSDEGGGNQADSAAVGALVQDREHVLVLRIANLVVLSQAWGQEVGVRVCGIMCLRCFVVDVIKGRHRGRRTGGVQGPRKEGGRTAIEGRLRRTMASGRYPRSLWRKGKQRK